MSDQCISPITVNEEDPTISQGAIVTVADRDTMNMKRPNLESGKSGASTTQTDKKKIRTRKRTL